MRVAQHESERVQIDIASLDDPQRQKLLRDLPLYCVRALLRPGSPEKEAIAFISRFRVGKTAADLQAMETIIGIILDRADYEQNPFDEQTLAKTITEFLWHFRRRLDFEVWQLLQRNFDMTFFVMKNDLPYLKNNMQQIVEKLCRLSGPMPFYPLEKTQRFIRGKLREYSQHHTGMVSLKREILEEQLRQMHDLQHDEYIPFYESLFVAWNAHGLPLLDVGTDAANFEPMNVPEEPEIHYDEDAKALCIRENVVKLAANAAKQRHLAAVLARDSDLGKEWLYDEIIEDVDHDQPTVKLRESYDNAAYQLNEKVRKETGMKDFLIKTNKTVKINPQYLI